MIRKIMICDDEENDRTNIREVVSEYYGDKAQIVLCSNDTELKEAFCRETFDIVFLDIEMPGKNGIEIKNELEYRGITSYIIFVTSYGNFMQDAFGKNVCGYIRKPLSVNRNKLFQVLGRIDEIDFQGRQIELEDTTGQVCKVRIGDIQYIRGDRIHTVLIIEEKQISVRKTLNEWEEELKEEFFVRIQKSYIVNLCFVDKIIGQKVFMKNCKALKMTRDREQAEKIKGLYLEYIRKTVRVI